MHEKLKSWLQNDRHFFGFLLIICTVAAFFLGRASVGTEEAAPVGAPAVVITPAPRPASLPAAQEVDVSRGQGSGDFVASKSGTKYHRSDCPGATQIKPENLIHFATAAAAEAAGYTPAANCPGL